VRAFVEAADLVIHIGPHNTDVTTFSGTGLLPDSSTLSLYTDHANLFGSHLSSVSLKPTLLELCKSANFSGLRRQNFGADQKMAVVRTEDAMASPITQKWLWARLSQWLKTGDIIVTDTGTASFGIMETEMPPKAILINTVLWASIGYALPSAQGAAIAATEIAGERRTIVFQGDGSFQLTCQEISTMIKHKLSVFLFVCPHLFPRHPFGFEALRGPAALSFPASHLIVSSADIKDRLVSSYATTAIPSSAVLIAQQRATMTFRNGNIGRFCKFSIQRRDTLDRFRPRQRPSSFRYFITTTFSNFPVFRYVSKYTQPTSSCFPIPRLTFHLLVGRTTPRSNGPASSA
jgi:hypothetical protein